MPRVPDGHDHRLIPDYRVYVPPSQIALRIRLSELLVGLFLLSLLAHAFDMMSPSGTTWTSLTQGAHCASVGHVAGEIAAEQDAGLTLPNISTNIARASIIFIF